MVPTGKLATVKLASPLSSAAVPSTTLPLRKVTLPLGISPLLDCTLALNVTLAPCAALAVLLLSVVTVLPWLTVSASTPELQAALLRSPAYTAVRLSVPTARLPAVVANVATPAALRLAVPSAAVPL